MSSCNLRRPSRSKQGRHNAKWPGTHTQRGQCRSWPDDIRLHRLLRRLDHFCDHRPSDPEGSWIIRDRVRPSGRRSNTDWLAFTPVPRNLGGPVRWPDRQCGGHGVVRAGDMASHIRLQLSRISACRTWSGTRGRLVLGINNLRLEILPGREAGGGPGNRRGRQCRRSSDEVCRPDCHGRHGLERRRQRLGRWAHCCGRDLFCIHERRSRAGGAARLGNEAAQFCCSVRATAECPGLALLALLFLRVRGVRGALAVAAALSDRCVWLRHRDGWHAGCRLLNSSVVVPHLWRLPVGSGWGPDCHVLDLPGVRRHHLLSVLPADLLCRRRRARPHQFST